MPTATLIRELNDRQWLFRLDPPAKVCRDNDETTEYVISSRCLPEWHTFQGSREVYLFPSNKDGKFVSWLEMPGSQKHCEDIEKPLRDLGYEIVR